MIEEAISSHHTGKEDLPGVNLSEQGNAGWVTCQMQLVHAAKYDVSTMMTQEKQLFKFDQNLETSTGCGPTQAVRASHDRSEQVTVGEEFVEIISDEEAIEEAARQAWEPAGIHYQRSNVNTDWNKWS